MLGEPGKLVPWTPLPSNELSGAPVESSLTTEKSLLGATPLVPPMTIRPALSNSTADGMSETLSLLMSIEKTPLLPSPLLKVPSREPSRNSRRAAKVPDVPSFAEPTTMIRPDSSIASARAVSCSLIPRTSNSATPLPENPGSRLPLLR